jgi:hypothetical protein
VSVGCFTAFVKPHCQVHLLVGTPYRHPRSALCGCKSVGTLAALHKQVDEVQKVSFSALYSKFRTGRRLTDLDTEG